MQVTENIRFRNWIRCHFQSEEWSKTWATLGQVVYSML